MTHGPTPTIAPAAAQPAVAARQSGVARRDEMGEVEAALPAAAAGDGDAWRMLVQAYTPRVFGLMNGQCRDRDLAEELTQSAFVKVVRKLADFCEGGERATLARFEPWLFRIAMNGLRDEMRRRKRQARPIDMSPAATAGGDDEA